MSATTQTIRATSAANFLGTLGTDTHMAYTDGNYVNVTQVIADLKYLGITQVRDGITDGFDANGIFNGSAPITTYLAMAEAGIKFTFIFEPTNNASIQTELTLINQVETAVPGSITALEGPNEINNFTLTFNGVSGQAGAIAAQQALYAAVKADATLAGVPVDYFTGYSTGSTDPTTTAGLANFDNQHPYPQKGEAPAFWVSRAQALTNLIGSDVATAPAVYTETGYSTTQVNTDVQEQYTLDLVMDTANDGISKTYLYDLLDGYAPGSVQTDDGFGLFDYTGAAKPVATALHNLTTLLQDSGATAASFTPASLTYTISGLPSTGNSMVLEKSNGTYVLVVWAEPQIFNVTTGVETASPSENVTVTLPQAFSSIQVFDPTTGTSALATTTNSSSVTVAVTDHPILIELSAAAVTAVAPPVLTIAKPVQVANTSEVVLSGTVTDATATSVQVKDGSTVLGTANVSNGSWSYTSANLTAGSHNFSAVATDQAGNTTTASDAAFTITAPALSITYNTGVDTSTTTRSTSVTTAVSIGGTGSSTIVLAISEDAYLGDAQFTVSVDGVQIGGVQTATALHSAGASQNFTLLGNFSTGTHTVSVDFLNDASAIYSNNTLAGDRNLYVNSITGNGVKTVENVEQNLAGTTSYAIKLPAPSTGTTSSSGSTSVTKPTIAIASQILTQDTGASATDDVTSNGAVTLTGTVTGATGTAVTILDGTTLLGSATISSGNWSYTTTLGAGTHALHAVATDPSGNTVASAAEPTITVDKTAPALTIKTPVAVANSTEVVLSGTVTDATATSVQVKDGSTVLGTASVSNGSWSYTSANLTAGSHNFSAVATDLAGNTTTASDAAFTITAPALSITYNTGVDTSTTTRSTSVTTAVSIGGTGSSTIVLAISEDAYLGDAQFTVSVDGVQIGGVQTATALHSAGASQNFTLLGNFSTGTHTVSVDFLNDASAIYSNNTLAGDRNLYVNSITGNGVKTVENVEQNLAGTTSYAIKLPAPSTGTTSSSGSTSVTKPTIAIASQILTQDTGASATDDVTSNGAVTLTGTVTGATGTAVTILDGTTLLGSATISSGNWSYTTTLGAGTHALHAVATDPSGNTVASAAEPTITVDKTAPALTIKTPVAVANSTEVVLSGTVTDATATSVQVKDGSTVLGTASVSNGSWSYTSANLTAGSHNFSAVATDQAGNTTTASDSAFTITAPALSITYNTGVDTSTTTRSTSVTTAVSIGGTGSSTIVLAISEDAYLGDAQFTVSVDGVQIGGVQTATALHSAGASQNFTLLGNFSTGTHTVSVDFLNDASAIYSNNTLAGDRNLYVNSITGNGVKTVENVEQNLAGTTSYAIKLPAPSTGTTSSSGSTSVTKPTIAIASQILTQDTGASATDDVTSNGAVTLTGTVTGATGTAVTILDGTTLLGSATISSGNWSYTTTLGAGTHALHAVATDPSGNTVASAAEPTITVDNTAPVLTINTPVAVANTTEVALSGTVTDATTTSVQVKDGSTVLGTASVSNGSWSYTSANLTAGSHNFSAVATDQAGNTTTASDAAFTITTPVTTSSPPVTTTPDEVLATVSNGSGTTQQEVDLSSATPVSGTYVPVSTSGIGTNSLVLYNWNPATQLQGFLAAQKAGTASIVGIGDSWTNGFGSATSGWSQLSYLNEMTQALTQDGIAAQSDNFLGSEFYITNGEVDDNRLTPVGYPTTSTAYDGGFSIVAGGNAISLASAGKGFNFQLDTPGNFNELTLSYIDLGSGSVSLTVDGVAVGNMSFGNTGQTLTQTIKIPAGSHSDLVVESTSANPVYIQGASFSSTTNPAISVYNAGIGGWDSANADTSVYDGSTIKGSGNGFGETASAAALKPSLALIDLGTNDIAGGEDTTAQTLANIEQIVATLQAAGTDVIIMIPQPFGSDAYATELPALRAGLEAYSTANNVPLIDLSATYGDSEAALEAAGLKADLLHGDATLYADIGSQLATLLTQTINSGASASNTVLSTNTLLSTTLSTTATTSTIVLSSATQTVAVPASSVLIQGTAAQAGAKILGNGQSSTRFEITTGGTAVLNAADTLLTVKLDAATNLTLSPMQFITADGSTGGSTITALAINQTLLGGRGDTLIGAAAFGDIFKGSAADLNGDIIKNFGGSDQIDVTDLLASKVTGINWTANAGGGVLSLTDGTHSTTLTLLGNYTSSSFKLGTDGGAGTRITS